MQNVLLLVNRVLFINLYSLVKYVTKLMFLTTPIHKINQLGKDSLNFKFVENSDDDEVGYRT